MVPPSTQDALWQSHRISFTCFIDPEGIYYIFSIRIRCHAYDSDNAFYPREIIDTIAFGFGLNKIMLFLAHRTLDPALQGIH